MSDGMTRVVCLGDIMVDICAQVPGDLAIGSDTPAPIALYGGGSAANTAAWLVDAGCSATVVGRVGADALGRQALDELARCGVDLAVSVDPDLPTGTCIVLVGPDGERTMIPSPGANANGGTAPPAYPDTHLHVSGYALFHDAAGPAALAALAATRTAGGTVSVDAASAAPLRSYGPARFLDAVAPALLLANLDEAAVFAGTRDADSAARLLGLRCGEAIVKQGAAGATWSDGKHVVQVACEPVAVFDSTGAGDAFAAGVLAARLSGAGVAQQLQAGHRLAARAVARPGGRP
ncbi:MAG TPA: sugar kinase [Jatrophihabitans sp.]|jgi:sugar/nucleoside kinase (ribokinase family)